MGIQSARLAPADACGADEMVAQGHSNKQVGWEVGISARTVANPLEHIFPQLGVITRAAASLYAACSPAQYHYVLLDNGREKATSIISPACLPL